MSKSKYNFSNIYKYLLCSVLSIAIIFSVFNVDTYAATGNDVVRTSYGSYTWESFQVGVDFEIPIINYPISVGSRCFFLNYNFDTPYTGTIQFYFNYVVHTYDWFILAHSGNASFRQSGTNYRVQIYVENCTGFGFYIVGPNGSAADQLVLDPNYNTQYSLTPIEDNNTILTSIDSHIGVIDTNVSNIINSVNGLYAYIDNLENYVDNVENLLSNISSLVNSILTVSNNTVDYEYYQIPSFNYWYSAGKLNIDSYGIYQGFLSGTYTPVDIRIGANDVWYTAFYSSANLWSSSGTFYIDNTDNVSMTFVSRDIVRSGNNQLYLYGVSLTNNTSSAQVVHLYSYSSNINNCSIYPLFHYYYRTMPDCIKELLFIPTDLDNISNYTSSILSNTANMITVISGMNSDINNNINNILKNYHYEYYQIPSLFYWISQGKNDINNGIYQGFLSGSFLDNIDIRIGANDVWYTVFYSSINLWTDNGTFYIDNTNNISMSFYARDIVINGYNLYVYGVRLENNSNAAQVTKLHLYNSNISSSMIYPIYHYYLRSMPDQVKQLINISTIEQSILSNSNTIINNQNSIIGYINDILDSINSLDLSVSYNITNEQVSNITNEFDTNIELVNNVEVNFNNSFDTSNDLITNNDLTLDFESLTPSLELYHGIFTSFYDVPLFKYVVIICLVGGAVLVLLG